MNEPGNELGSQQTPPGAASAETSKGRGFGGFFGKQKNASTAPIENKQEVPEIMPHVVTRQEAEAKNKEKEIECSTLMDQIEASREQQGDWFIKFGKKEEGGIDNRALVFIKPGIDNRTGVDRMVALTKDGLKEVYTDGKESVEEDLRMIPTQPRNEEFTYNHAKDRNGENLTIEHGDHELADFYLSESPMDGNVAKDAMQKSRDAAEAPHKEMVENAQKTINTIGSLRSMVSQFPPKQ